MKVFPQLSVPLHTHIEKLQSRINDQVDKQTLLAYICVCIKESFHSPLCVCRLLVNAVRNLSNGLDIVNEMPNVTNKSGSINYVRILYVWVDLKQDQNYKIGC